ncbi:MAG: carbohydrate ABC transporter permease [Lachnospiraceae bacterium]|nr:carbohydrate ABC transporter permease [Lachnospiraceae bacterium]
METRKKGLNIKTRRTIAYIVLILLTVLCLFWFYVLFVNTTRTHSQITTGFSAVPGTNFMKNWNTLMSGQLPVWQGLLNSLFVATASAVLCTYFSSMTAYAIHAYRFKGRKFIGAFILMIMMIPTQVTALGFLELIDKMGLDNSFIPLIVPAIASPVTYFYMKQYLQSSMPLSIIEAARIDGAGEFKIFNTIVIPIIKPAIAVQAIFGFVLSWNNYFTPALVLHSNSKKTLPLLIAQLRSADYLKFDMGQVYMMILFSILPVVVVYLILSKQIVEGVAVGSVKG